jgi:hypothetical protein
MDDMVCRSLLDEANEEIKRLEALVAKYRVYRREWKERTLFDRYAAGVP